MILEIIQGDRRAPARHARLRTIVAAAREAAAREAGQVLADALGRADEIVERARVDADAIRARAEAEGRAAGERSWAEAAVALAVDECENALAREAECVRLAIEIARRVLGAALDREPELVAELARRACEGLRREAPLRLEVASSDASRAGAIRSALGEWPVVEIVVDERLAPGSCVAHCNGVRVDASLETQLAVLEERLLGARAGEVVQ